MNGREDGKMRPLPYGELAKLQAARTSAAGSRCAAIVRRLIYFVRETRASPVKLYMKSLKETRENPVNFFK